MKFLLLLLLLLSQPGCGKGPNTIDPVFQPLYNNFIVDATTNGVDVTGDQGISMQFSDLDEGHLGECSAPGYGNRSIRIDTNTWKVTDYITHFLVVYHELGHCLLNEIHKPDPDAIMNAFINNPYGYYNTELGPMTIDLFKDIGDADK